jgi:hypothetical protein
LGSKITLARSRQSVTLEDFAKLGSKARWTELDVIYYCGISVWNFINCPFFLTESEFKTGEIAPLDTDGEVWRRLQFTFPNRIATEACEQILYFDFWESASKDGLLAL